MNFSGGALTLYDAKLAFLCVLVECACWVFAVLFGVHLSASLLSIVGYGENEAGFYLAGVIS